MIALPSLISTIILWIHVWSKEDNSLFVVSIQAFKNIPNQLLTMNIA